VTGGGNFQARQGNLALMGTQSSGRRPVLNRHGRTGGNCQQEPPTATFNGPLGKLALERRGRKAQSQNTASTSKGRT